MELVLIRHGHTDYTPADLRGFIGHGRDLSPLSERGVRQAEEVAKSPALLGCELILSSPYTRALQTAAIVSCAAGLRLVVEMDLREWQPDRTHQYNSSDIVWAQQEDYDRCRGIHPAGQLPLWESVAEMIARIKPVLDRYYYQGYRRLAIAAHGMVIQRLTGINEPQHCTPYEVTYTPSFSWHPWTGKE